MKWSSSSRIAGGRQYNTKVVKGDEPVLISDTTEDTQLRRVIFKSIEDMDIEQLKRIAYECRCEEMGLSLIHI